MLKCNSYGISNVEFYYWENATVVCAISQLLPLNLTKSPFGIDKKQKGLHNG
jgi:hypothetical protein